MQYLVLTIQEDWNNNSVTLSVVELPDHIKEGSDEFNIALYDLKGKNYTIDLEIIKHLMKKHGLDDIRDLIGKFVNFEGVEIIELANNFIYNPEAKHYRVLEVVDDEETHYTLVIERVSYNEAVRYPKLGEFSMHLMNAKEFGVLPEVDKVFVENYKNEEIFYTSLNKKDYEILIRQLDIDTAKNTIIEES